MSNTRYAKPGGPLRQERYASSAQRGYLANLVALKCAGIRSKPDRELIWYFQWRSWMPGGVNDVFDEICSVSGQSSEVLKCWFNLNEMCLDLGYSLNQMVDFVRTECTSNRQSWIDRSRVSGGPDVAKRVVDALEYTRSAECLTVIQGDSRIGKSFATKAWCSHTAGMARYAPVPSSNDDWSFFRAIADSLGVSDSLQLKASELRGRIEKTLIGSDLMLVLDEGHYLFSQNWQRYAMPSRVNWITTALVERGVPVAIIATPQIKSALKKTEELTGWNSDQFRGRIGHYEDLPALSKADAEFVAEAMFPKLDRDTQGVLAKWACASNTRLGALTAISDRSTWYAGQEGRAEPNPKDVQQAMRERACAFDNPVAESASGFKRPGGTAATHLRNRRDDAAVSQQTKQEHQVETGNGLTGLGNRRVDLATTGSGVVA